MLMTMVIEEKPQREQELNAARLVRRTGNRNLMEGGYQIKVTGLNDSDGVYRYDARKNQNVPINSNYSVAFHGQIEQGRFNGRQQFRNQEQQQLGEDVEDKSWFEMATSSVEAATVMPMAKLTTTITMPRYLCVLYVATGGLQGALLGSDEDEVVLLIYILIDSYHRSVLSKQQFIVRPSNADINENIVSEQLQSKSSTLSSDFVKSGGKSLEHAIEQFDQYIRHFFHSMNTEMTSEQFAFVTDGQLPLRQCLHPETCKKNIPLPSYYNRFIDLQKEVFRFARQHADDKTPLPVQSFNFYSSIPELLTLLNITSESDKEYFIQEATDLVRIVQKLLIEDHKFNEVETVNIKLEPGICSVNDEVDDNCVVRARGLPWQSSDQDIAKFFRGLNIEKGGVALCLSVQGRRNGEAVIRFTCEEHRDMALKRHRHHMSSRYIEVYRASGDEFLSVAGGASNEAQAFLSRGAQVIIRMRGLPYDCTAKQVLDFFNSGENACMVLDGEDGVLFVKKAHGRATGDAFVLFANEFDAPKALTKHRELIGSRYIELFRSTTAEVQQVLNRSMDPVKYDSPRAQNHQQNQQVSHQTHAAAVAAVAAAAQIPYLPQHVITSGTLKDCIRLRGLPYEAQVEHILEFLGEHAKNIVFQGVHMVYNAQGQPSGEAFIQMNSEQSAFLAATQRHHRFMGQGKKPRYIEVFQCSGEDMNIVLTGGINTAQSSLSPASMKNGPTAVAAASAAAAAALLSPGNTLISATGPQSQAAGLPTPHANPAQFLAANQANFATFAPIAPHQIAAVAAASRQFYPIPTPLLYWPYPSPPVSPSGAYFTSGGPLPTNAAAIMESECLANVVSPTQPQSQQLLPSSSPPVVTSRGNDHTLCTSSMAPLPPIHITQLPAYASRVHEHIMIMDELGRANFIQNHSFHLQHHPLNVNTSATVTGSGTATSTSANSPQQQFVELLI